jgi:hypothetical protein
MQPQMSKAVTVTNEKVKTTLTSFDLLMIQD